jgi:hypothetical protein
MLQVSGPETWKKYNSVIIFNNTEAYTETPERVEVQTPKFRYRTSKINKIVPKMIPKFRGAEFGKFSQTSGKRK